MEIRAFEEGDLKRCQEIAGSVIDYTHVLDLRASHIFVAEEEGTVVGFGFIHVWQWNKVAWIGDLVVEEGHRGRGIGTKLVQHLAKVAKNDGCIALMDDPPPKHPVIGFYLRLGFRLCGYNDSYFANPRNRMAVFMCLDIHEGNSV